jgi:hypothetical protein
VEIYEAINPYKNVSDKQRIWNPLKNKIICLIYVIEPGVSAIVNKDAIGRRSEISTNPENCEDKKPHLTGRKESRVSMLMKVENARICRSSIIGRSVNFLRHSDSP